MKTSVEYKVLELVKKLFHHQLLNADQYTLSMRTGDQMLCVPPNTQETLLSIDDLAFIDLNQKVPHPFNEYAIHSALYKANHRFNVIVHSCTPALLTLSRAGETVKPVLDDFAQLIGVNAKVVKGDANSLVHGIKNRTAVFVENKGAICAATNEDDIFAVTFVLNKNSVALIETSVLNGGKPISWIESALMSFFYKRRYSKNADKNKK